MVLTQITLKCILKRVVYGMSRFYYFWFMV